MNAQPFYKRPGFFSRYVWLAYSVFFFIQPVMHNRLREWLGFAAFFIVFLFLYCYPEVKPRTTLWCVVGLMLLGMIYMPINPGVAGIFIFVGAFLPFAVRSAAAVISGLVVLAAVICAESYALHLPAWTWGTIAVVTLVVGVANLSHAREKRAEKKLLRAQEEIEHLATVAERERIARDLHDVLGHTLSMITLKAELAGKLLTTDPQRAALEIADVEQSARHALAEVREAVGGYRAQGLPAELARASQTLASAGVDLQSDAPPRGLPAGEETVLALIVREAVTNIVRHASAKQCTVRFVTESRHVLLIIHDNGSGGVAKEGNGLRGMRERAEALGGQFSWQCGGRGIGMELRIQLPIPLPTVGQPRLPVSLCEDEDVREESRDAIQRKQPAAEVTA